MLPRLSGVSRMSLDRPRPGIAVPDALPSPRVLRGAGLRKSAWLSALAAMVAAGLATASAQLPPPARPPKPAAAAPKPDAPAAAPAKLPSGRSILDKHVAAI